MESGYTTVLLNYDITTLNYCTVTSIVDLYNGAFRKSASFSYDFNTEKTATQVNLTEKAGNVIYI